MLDKVVDQDEQVWDSYYCLPSVSSPVLNRVLQDSIDAVTRSIKKGDWLRRPKVSFRTDPQ